MDKKAESVKTVVMITASLIVLGLVFVAFGNNSTITSETTLSENACYYLYDGELSPEEVSQCCSAIKKSTGCKPYDDSLYVCEGDRDFVVNKNTIEVCENV